MIPDITRFVILYKFGSINFQTIVRYKKNHRLLNILVKFYKFQNIIHDVVTYNGETNISNLVVWLYNNNFITFQILTNIACFVTCPRVSAILRRESAERLNVNEIYNIYEYFSSCNTKETIDFLDKISFNKAKQVYNTVSKKSFIGYVLFCKWPELGNI